MEKQTARKNGLSIRLRALLYAHQDEADRLLTSVRKQLVPGVRVAWRHGQHVRAGLIVALGGFQLGNLSVKIESDTGRTYWVNASLVFPGLGL